MIDNSTVGFLATRGIAMGPTSYGEVWSGILSMIEQAAIAFDELSSQWSPDYEAHCQPLLQALDRAR